MKLFRQPGPGVFIFSAEKDCAAISWNHERTLNIKDELDEAAIPYKMVKGHVDGQDEVSFVVTESYHDLVLAYLHRYQQDCCLHVSSDHIVHKVYPNGHEELLGTFENVGTREPDGDYTYDPSTRSYFQVKEAA